MYERENKTFPVKGNWDGYHLDCSHKTNKDFMCCEMQPFRFFLAENGWLDSWFKLMPKYGTL